MSKKQTQNRKLTELIGKFKNRPDRWTFEQKKHGALPGVPELVLLGFDRFREAMPLKEHQHIGSYEIVYLEKGKVGWEVDGTVYETRAGEVFHTKPNEVHSGKKPYEIHSVNLNIIEPCQFYWMIFSDPHENGWLNLPTNESLLIRKELRNLPRNVFVGPQLTEPFRKMRKAIQQEDPLSSFKIRLHMLDVLLKIVDPEPLIGISDDSRLRVLIEEITSRPDWRPSVIDLAAHAGISPTHLYRLFREYTGDTPMQYMERLRIEKSCKLLAESQIAVTQIAHDLGFQSSQHFATVFKRYTGVTPTQWRKSLR